MSLWLPGRGLVPLPPAPAGGRARPVLFLDRDGVLIEDLHYLREPARVRLERGAADALRRARAAGYDLVGLSNQSGIGRGLYTEEEFAAVQRRVDDLLSADGIALDALFYCPHAPAAGCRCRKPGPGLLEEAALLFTWLPALCWLIGDKRSDLQLARAAGLRACLVRTGKGAAAERELAGGEADLVAEDLAAAVPLILERRT